MSANLNKTIQGLWIGPELSLMEQLSISSFLQNGHDYDLYVYDEVKKVPSGTVIRNANEILPAARIFQYQHRPSYAGFSNFFRYKLLLDRGGWWADSDTICLKAFDFPDEYVFSSEIDYRGVEVVASGIIKVPPGSSIMAYAWKVCENKNKSRLVWGEIGPKLMARAVRKFSLQEYKKGSRVFSPVNYEEGRQSCSRMLEYRLTTAALRFTCGMKCGASLVRTKTRNTMSVAFTKNSKELTCRPLLPGRVFPAQIDSLEFLLHLQ